MLRWRMLRHGAHQVNRPSLSGSSVAADVHQPAADDLLDQRALLGQLADRARLPLFRMHVAVGARDVQVAAEHEQPAVALERRGERVERLEERILAWKSLPPFGT